MRNPLYEFFYYTRAERNACIVLSTICFFCFLLPNFYPYLRSPEPPPDFTEFKKMIAPAIAQMEKHKAELEKGEMAFRGEREDAPEAELFFFDPNTASKDDLVRLGLAPRTAQTVLNYRQSGGVFKEAKDFKKLYTLQAEDYERLAPYISIKSKKGTFEKRGFEKEEAVAEAEHFLFDPNTATQEDFMRLGLSGRTAHSILNYRSAGGYFSEKEDFKKIYTLAEEDFERLLPWIEIAEPEEERPPFARSENALPKFEKKKWEPQAIDINNAPAEAWEQFRGIGPGFAKRIVNFREKLGGFVSAEQVAETYGLADSTFQAMRGYLEIPTGIYRPLMVNQAGLEELKSHPYLSSFQATILFNYRKQHGRFANLESMKKIKAGFKPADWERLAPYLSFE